MIVTGPLRDLVDPKRNDRAAGAHHIAVTGTADFGFAGIAGFCDRNLFFNGFCDTHSVYGIRRLVGRQADHALHTRFNSGSQHIVGTDHIGAHGLP